MCKKQAPLRIDHKNKKIIMNCQFAKKQSNIYSQEYRDLCEVFQMFPEYSVATKAIKKNPKKESYKGLTYRYMEEYISLKGTARELEAYNDMRLLAKCHSKRYSEIKKWFLNLYPEVKQYGARPDFLAKFKRKEVC